MKHHLLLLFIVLVCSCQSKNTEKEDPNLTEKELDTINQINKEQQLLVSPSKAYIKNKNVFIAYTDGEEKKLTFTGQDSSPFLLKSTNQVLFIRSFGSGNHSYKHIMSVDINNLAESTIVDKKPYRDGLNDSQMIFSVENPMLSEDQKYLYFISEKYATSSALMRVNLKTKEWVEVSHAFYFSVVDKGVMQGNFAIGASEIRGQGRQAYWFIIDRKGNKLKDFGSSKDEMEHFLNTGNQKSKNANGKKMIIKKIILHSIPTRKPSGKNWDNMMSGYHPDIYLQVVDAKGTLIFGDQYSRIENVTKADLPITYPFEYTLKSATETLGFIFKDFDSISNHDELGACSFNSTGYSENEKSSRYKKDDFEIEIFWEWGK